MRGKAMSLEAIYPDGRKELISQVNDFQWNWHNNYIYADDVAPLFPKGTTLVITAWHDPVSDLFSDSVSPAICIAICEKRHRCDRIWLMTLLAFCLEDRHDVAVKRDILAMPIYALR